LALVVQSETILQWHRAGFSVLAPEVTEEIDHYVMAVTLPERVACDDPLRSHTGSWMEVCDALDAYNGRPGLVEHVERLG
jgi:hypothetical protein